jgi:Mn2+/Fe2+ NRAMP family transporter
LGKSNNFWQAFGPGILFAATAIGVSHLVQSTRAGAEYGYALLWAVILANIFKYPFFEFGTRYAQGTGSTLLTGYYKMGKWPLWMYVVITLISMFTVTAAVSFVTTALISNLTGWDSPLAFQLQAAGLYAFCVLLLLLGQFKALDKFIKVIALILVLAILVALFSLLMSKPEHAPTMPIKPFWEDEAQFIFLIALMGWMPTAVDLSAWNSIWTVERMHETGYQPSLKQALLDFKIGYWASAVLAVFFLVFGAELIFYAGESFPDSAPAFTAKLIALFTSQVGQWSYFIIAVAAFAVMFSTTVTVFDGYSRALSESAKLLFNGRWVISSYGFWLLLTAIGGLLVVLYFNQQIKKLVDLATMVSFLIAPVVAILNFKLVNSKQLPRVAKPAIAMNIWAALGIAFLLIFSITYVFVSIS